MVTMTVSLIVLSGFWFLALIYPMAYDLRRASVLITSFSSYSCFLLSIVILRRVREDMPMMREAYYLFLSLGLFLLSLSALFFLRG